MSFNESYALVQARCDYIIVASCINLKIVLNAMKSHTELLTDENIHQKVIVDTLLEAKTMVWIATANLKDMHIKARRGYQPILKAFDEMAVNGVLFRIIHSDIPSQSFRNTLETFPRLMESLEFQICIRCHWKMVIVDGVSAYMGSANFTGAGLGVKSKNRRNLEVGLLTQDPGWVKQLTTQFDQFWIGQQCMQCSFRDKCPDPIDE